jgi:ABC-type antimicrobial peptide transport system permease subunit
MDDSLWQQRLCGVLLGIFAGISLVLAAVGLYEVMSFLVRLRTREIGIRIALGAPQASVLRMVLSKAIRLTGIGLAIGLFLALLAGRWAGTILFGVSAGDPPTLLVVVLVFAMVAAAASVIPVLRAARVDPFITLRQE